MIPFHWSLEHPDLRLALIEADDVRVTPSPTALIGALDGVIAQRAEGWPPPEIRTPVRRLLKHTGFKASGRNKPASEYLARAASGGDFPHINNLVDINNLLSLETGLPMSMLDRERALGDAEALEIRVGADDASYVFNEAGHRIRLKRLICIARVGGEAVGNPVKDSMTAKTRDDTRAVLAVLYAPRVLYPVGGSLEQLAERYAAMLTAHADASATRIQLLPA